MGKCIEFDGCKYEVPPSFPDKRVFSFLRHLSDYKFISNYVVDSDVLDIGCGYGYGSFLLSLKAKKVTGIDTSEERICRAKGRYKAENLNFLVADAMMLEKEFESEGFDRVVAMQLIEHLKGPNKFIESVKCLMKRDGILILATPNQLLRTAKGSRPWNPEHIMEYSPRTFSDFLRNYFDHIEFHSLLGSRRAYQKEKIRIGGTLPLRLKALWRYTPQRVREVLRKQIDSKLRTQDLTVNDYYITQGLNEQALGFFAFCHNCEEGVIQNGKEEKEKIY